MKEVDGGDERVGDGEREMERWRRRWRDGEGDGVDGE
jgi:hypothetical protein